MSTRAHSLAPQAATQATEVEQATLSFSVTNQTRTQPQARPQTANVAPPATTLLNVPGVESPGIIPNPDAITRALSATTPQNSQPQAVSAAVIATPSATPKPAFPDCDAAQSKLYCVYTVGSGDTLSTIAVKFGIKGNDDLTAAEMLAASNKPDVVDEDELSIGQKLRVPTASGVVHTVLSAQTLGDIATQYDVASRDILALASNGIGDADSLRVGQEVLIPNPTRFAAPAPAPTPPPVSAAAGSGSSSGSSSSSSSGSAPAARTGPVSGSGMIWPVGGPISSYFGPSHPLGIDIDLFAAPNAPIGATRAGTVTFAGGNPCCSYGYYVVVDHGGGVQTLYAHFSSISVSVGQKVSQGQILGLGGRTGYATGNHLHFEVHVNGSIVNPMTYLP